MRLTPQIQLSLVVIFNCRHAVSFPLALAAAIGLEPGDQVQWELLDRGELHLLRVKPAPLAAKAKSRKS